MVHQCSVKTFLISKSFNLEVKVVQYNIDVKQKLENMKKGFVSHAEISQYICM